MASHTTTPAVRLSSIRFTFYLALFYVLVINLPLSAALLKILQHQPVLHMGFVLSLPLFFLALFYILFSLFSVRYLAKPFFIVLTLLSSVVSYVMFNYGVLVDSNMVRNVAETHYGEALSYLNLSALTWVSLMGVLPALLIYKAQLVYHPPVKELLHKLGSMAVAALVIALIAALYFKNYSAVGRNNSYLNKMIIPTHYVYSTAKYIHLTYLRTPTPYQTLGTDAELAAQPTSKPSLLVLVVGETARSMNFELNGYHRETNAFTRDKGVISFQSVSSCGTATAVSVPCMFSRFGRAKFDPDLAKNQDNLLDVLQHAGLNVQWMENDGGCKGVCKRIETVTFNAKFNSPHCDGEYCRDEVLLDHLQPALERMRGQPGVLVLHLVGSHGPTYFQRYPEQFRRFQPDCPRSDIQNCDERAIINTYDNTLYYDDFILSQVIDALNNQGESWNSSLLYISDHGESLGENGLFLHGMPYSLAPAEQTQVPLITWFSDGFSQQQQLDTQCVQEQASLGQFSHDNLFDTVLGLMQVQSTVYQPQMDMLARCRGSFSDSTATTVESENIHSDQTVIRPG